MTRSRWERFAPLTGVLFFAFIAAVFVLDNNTPNDDDSTASVVSYWSAHTSKATIAGLCGFFAVLFLIWFGGSLRRALLRAEGGDGRLSMLAFGGILVLGTGGAIASSLDFTLGQVATEVPAGVVQTLSVLDQDLFFPLALGFALTLFATGLCTIRYGAMPKWLGWASIVIGILNITPLGFFGIVLSLLWVLVVSIILFRAEGSAQPATST
jgi:hypothetical protein